MDGRGWEGLNLGSIPNDHMPSQKNPKISIERRCSTILPQTNTKDRGRDESADCLGRPYLFFIWVLTNVDICARSPLAGAVY